jgi:ABC-type nitrate/sulfonate/bicarbonate transport system permease component
MVGAFKRLSGGLPIVYALLAVVFIWQLAVVATNPHVSILPSPWLTARTFADLVVSGELFVHVGASLRRVVIAWVLVVDPFVELFRPISPLAWIPLAILWFGIGEHGKIFIIVIATFFPTLLNTVAGVKGVDPVLIRAGQVLGCTDERSLFVKVILPATLPQVMVGLRISFGTGWAAIIAAELVAARSGLGYLIADGMEILRSDYVLVGMVMIGLLGVAFDMMFRQIDRRYGWLSS